MKTSALQRKLMDEFLEKIKDRPDVAKNAMKEAIDTMLVKAETKKTNKLSTVDAFDSWVGTETTE